MRVLWAPWRMTYLGGPKEAGCIFCNALRSDQPRQSLVLAHSPALVMLNRYPYGSGHLMVAPLRHTADFSSLAPDELHSLMDVVQRTDARMREAFRPDGMNIGINLGAAAGAGVVDHLHWHLVPRWVGDTNFMPTLGDVKVISEHLEATYDRLSPLFQP